MIAARYAQFMLKTPAAFFGICLMVILSCVRVSQGQESPTTPQVDKAWSLRLSPESAVDMAWIPAGTFMMGSPESEPQTRPDERPQTKVTLTKGFGWAKRISPSGNGKPSLAAAFESNWSYRSRMRRSMTLAA